MDRKSFLQKLGMGIGAAVLTPSLIKSAIIAPESEAAVIIAPDMFQWNSSQIFIRAINRNPDPRQIVLFGVKQNFTDNPLPDGVTIQVAGSSIQNLNNMILAHPVRIIGLKIKSPTRIKPDIHKFDLWNIYSDGRMDHRIFQPINYCSVQQPYPFNNIDIPSFELLLTPNVYITTAIDGHQQVDYVFNIANDRANIPLSKISL